jgi:hypothetical protein
VRGDTVSSDMHRLGVGEDVLHCGFGSFEVDASPNDRFTEHILVKRAALAAQCRWGTHAHDSDRPSVIARSGYVYSVDIQSRCGTQEQCKGFDLSTSGRSA